MTQGTQTGALQQTILFLPKGTFQFFMGGLEGDAMFLYLRQSLAISVLELGSTVFSRE